MSRRESSSQWNTGEENREYRESSSNPGEQLNPGLNVTKMVRRGELPSSVRQSHATYESMSMTGDMTTDPRNVGTSAGSFGGYDRGSSMMVGYGTDQSSAGFQSAGGGFQAEREEVFQRHQQEMGDLEHRRRAGKKVTKKAIEEKKSAHKRELRELAEKYLPSLEEIGDSIHTYMDRILENSELQGSRYNLLKDARDTKKVNRDIDNVLVRETGLTRSQLENWYSKEKKGKTRDKEHDDKIYEETGMKRKDLAFEAESRNMTYGDVYNEKVQIKSMEYGYVQSNEESVSTALDGGSSKRHRDKTIMETGTTRGKIRTEFNKRKKDGEEVTYQQVYTEYVQRKQVQDEQQRQQFYEQPQGEYEQPQGEYEQPQGGYEQPQGGYYDPTWGL